MKKDAALVTGYPNYVVKLLVRKLAEQGRPVFLLCKDHFEQQAAEDFGDLKDAVRLVSGDVVCMDLGLSGDEVKEIRRRVSVIFHLAGIYYLGSSDRETELVNIEGTRNAIAFAIEVPDLKRFLHYSTAFVSGNREGVIMEDELTEPTRFRNAFERTKYYAERVVRQAMADLPVSIVRPSLVVGHSLTGEIDRLDGPHFFMNVLVNLPINVPLPLLGRGEHPLNLVPVDYVVEAMAHIVAAPDAAGRTFHLVDLNPLPARQVFDLICKAADKKPMKGAIPSNLATALLKMPGLERHWRSSRLFVECMNQLTIYNAMNTTELLRGTGISCPPFPSYAGNLVAFLKRKRKPDA